MTPGIHKGIQCAYKDEFVSEIVSVGIFYLV